VEWGVGDYVPLVRPGMGQGSSSSGLWQERCRIRGQDATNALFLQTSFALPARPAPRASLEVGVRVLVRAHWVVDVLAAAGPPQEAEHRLRGPVAELARRVALERAAVHGDKLNDRVPGRGAPPEAGRADEPGAPPWQGIALGRSTHPGQTACGCPSRFVSSTTR
jgi:hypothetical protein